MKPTILHLALRETQSGMASRITQTALFAIGIILGIAGPFGTEEAMRLIPRIFYWIAVSQVTFASGIFVSVLSATTKHKTGVQSHIFAACVGVVIGGVICVEIFLFNWGIFGISPLRAGYALPLLLNIMGVSVIIRVAISVIQPHKADPIDRSESTIAPAQAPQAKLLDRLPFDKRGALISLSVNDHYVDVTTTKGTEMILMRLVDAIGEAGQGLQVHRSHWVATNHIISVTKDGAKAVIKTTDGRDIPVSRTYVPILKEAGFLS